MTEKSGETYIKCRRTCNEISFQLNFKLVTMKTLIVLVVFSTLAAVSEQRQARHTDNFQRYWSLLEVKFEKFS